MKTNSAIKVNHSATARSVKTIVTLFILITVLLAGLIYIESRVFDGIRSYVRGEGLWAKAQKDAVLHLERYTYEHDDIDYAAFERSIQVIAGDKQARLALMASPRDMEKARAGFLQGQNDAQDVDSLIWFFLNFRSVSYMRDAIDIWIAADAMIEELTSAGAEIKLEVSSHHPSPAHLQALRNHLRVLNTQLLDLENQFSEVLSEGARWVKTTVWRLSLALMFTFLGAGIWIARKILREIVESEWELLISESRFTSLKESNTIGIVSWHGNDRINDANDLFLNMLGYNKTELAEGRLTWQKLTPPEWHERDRQASQELDTYGRCEPYEKAFIHKRGFTVPVIMGASLLKGDKEHGIAFVVDITEKKRIEDIIKQQANYDTLTELPNRRMVYDRLKQQMKMSRRNNLPLALLFIDLDGFKEVNDRFGHETGDTLLKEAARRMLACVRESDTLGRLGGDEFIIIVGQLDHIESVNRIANDILMSVSEPYILDGETANISTSIGISLYPDDADDVSTLITCADQAMYAVKREGRNGIRYYASMNADDN